MLVLEAEQPLLNVAWHAWHQRLMVLRPFGTCADSQHRARSLPDETLSLEVLFEPAHPV